MSAQHAPTDRALIRRLNSRTRGDLDFWSFADTARSRGGREPYQYPAMMVSPMQGELLSALCEHRGQRPVVFDPFVGSGTTLTEAMRLGCGFVGCDINPLAVLLSTVKAEACADLDLPAVAANATSQARRNTRSVTERGPWVRKWFRADVAADLSALRRAIREHENPLTRRAMWLALAEVVRTSGNMRPSRPKLQTRPEHELARTIDILARFLQAAQEVHIERQRHAQELHAAGHVRSGRYRRAVALCGADVRAMRWPTRTPRASIVLTSPPYGDNHTTMPYGQHSYLPLRWIDLKDIPTSIDPHLLTTSKTLDTNSLGGSRRFNDTIVSDSSSRSATLSKLLGELVEHRDGWTRVASFFADLNEAWDAII
ncbi:MAG: DNA methyltransferase, partial [Solirubrobacteraceae bacterium]